MANRYQNVTLQVSNVQAGESITVDVTPNGGNIGWSSGVPFQASGGIKILAESGALPLSQFILNSSSLTVTTSSSGSSGSLQFAVQLSLVADDTVQTFYLRAVSSPSVQVAVALEAGPLQVVNSTMTLFSWNPI